VGALLLVALLFGAGVVAIGVWTWGETTASEPPPLPDPEPMPPRLDRRPAKRPTRGGGGRR
jgi:hypothetical protein